MFLCEAVGLLHSPKVGVIKCRLKTDYLIYGP